MDAADIASRHPDMVTPPGNVLTKPRTNACKRHALAQLDSSSVCKESLLRQRYHMFCFQTKAKCL